MTAHELARKLLAGPDLPVHHVYNYGDHWRTEVAPLVEWQAEGMVVYSAYHQMPKVLEGESIGNPGQQRVVLLS